MKYGKLKPWNDAAQGDVIYVPENAESLEDACTKQRFIDLCNGDERDAKALFSACEWQFPETILDEATYSDAVDQGQGSLKRGCCDLSHNVDSEAHNTNGERG